MEGRQSSKLTMSVRLAPKVCGRGVFGGTQVFQTCGTGSTPVDRFLCLDSSIGRALR